MTDFFADLESELLGAARRRAAGERARWRPRMRLPRLAAPAVAFAVVIGALAVVFVNRPDPGRNEAVTGAGPAPALVPAGEAFSGGACDPKRAPLRAPGGAGPAAVLDAVPALPRDPRTAVPLPRAAVEALQDLRVRAAYVDTVAVLPVEGQVSVSVVPVTGAEPCVGARPTGTAEFEGDGACLLAVEGERLLATMCQPVSAIRRGRLAARQVARRTVVLGFSEPESRPVAFETAGGGVGLLRRRGGIIAEVIADGARAEIPPGTPSIATADSPATVALLNGTTDPRLAAEAMGRLESAGIEPGAIESFTSQTVRRSRVFYRSASAAGLAALVAGRLGIEEFERRRAPGAGRAAVTVLLGADLARGARPRVAVIEVAPRESRDAGVAIRVMKRLGQAEIAGFGRPELGGDGSRVLYAPGERAAAAEVARALGVSVVRPKAGDPAGRVAKEPVVVVVDEDLRDRLR